MKLSDIGPAKGAVKRNKRRGKGPATGNGCTAGKGNKGQKCRSGGNIPRWLEGGQMPLQRRLPAKGFNNKRNHKFFEVVKLSDLEKHYNDGDTVTFESLSDKNLIRRRKYLVKIVGTGELKKKLTVRVHKCTKTAKEAIEKLGGKVEEV